MGAFAEAESLYRSLGEEDRAATCVHNQGFAAAQAGDLPTALAHYSAARLDEDRYPESLVDRANALTAAGLLDDAGQVLARAARRLGAAGRGPAFADATLAHARRLLRAGDPGAAKAAATAGALFRAQNRESWRLVADAVHAMAAGHSDALALADGCERAGWVVEAAEVRLSEGRFDVVARHRHSADRELRALGWLARARSVSSRRAVLAACQAGLRSSARGPELALTGLEAAVDGGRARTVFSWSERYRAAHFGESSGSAPNSCAVLSLARVGSRCAAVSTVDGKFRFRLLPWSMDSERLDEMVFGWWRRELGDRPLLVLPDPGMAMIPWAALPTCQGRPVTVAPVRTGEVGTHGLGKGVWICGPGLSSAEREVRALHERFGGTLLVGGRATVGAAREALEGAGVAHIAAHGRVPRHAPGFAHIVLADGPLFAHELARVGAPPKLVVLAACESAGAAGFLGLVAAMVRRGTLGVVASVERVPDDACVRLMVGLYEGLAGGSGAAAALARAQREHGHLGFVLAGAG